MPSHTLLESYRLDHSLSHIALRGTLTDLRANGVGSIIPDDPAESVRAFRLARLRNVKAATFDAAGFKDGDAVEFQLNDHNHIESVRKLMAPVRKAA